MNSLVKGLAKLPKNLISYSNVRLTTKDAETGATPKDIVWTYRKTTLYRYRSGNRRHPVPIVLVFALINRPYIFDLRKGNSFVEFLLDEGYDVFMIDWGVLDDSDSETGIDSYVCDQIPWAIREVRRASGADEVTLIGWCIGAALAAIYLGLHPDAPVRNFVPLTMPLDPTGSTYALWLKSPHFDIDQITRSVPALPGKYIDTANRLLKPIPNFVQTDVRLWQQVSEGKVNKEAHQAMSKWVSDNPPFGSKAFNEWVTWIFKENRLTRGMLRIRGKRVDLSKMRQSMLVVTASADHIAPRIGTLPLLDMVANNPDVTHMDRIGGHIGLMAGSKARKEVWPDIAAWLEPRSQARTQ